MVGVALFGHEDSIHAQGDISKDGVTEIVDAVGVPGIVGIGVGQIGLQSFILSRWIGQAYFDFESEGIGIVIIVGARNGERDGLDARQGGLKLHLPRGFVPIIHIGHVKQLERHGADCPCGLTSPPFYTLSQSLLEPALPPGFFLVGPQNLPGIPHAHASGQAKIRAPFHLAALALRHPPGLQ